MQQNKIRQILAVVLILAGLGIIWLIADLIAKPLFIDQYSLIIEDNRGGLLGARIAPDGQWRFPLTDDAGLMSPKYKIAVLAYEDSRFYYHPGVDIFSIARAIRANWKAGRVVSGGSTLTMQLVSLIHHHKAGNIFEKLLEMCKAILIDAVYSKDEIFQLFAAHAPFGGNTVGYQAAVWRYFGKHNQDLDWPEAALLAVLPNNPSLIHLGRNRAKLLLKRNQLLAHLASLGFFTSEDLALYCDEPLPDKPNDMPAIAPHLLSSIQKVSGLKNKYFFKTTIDHQLQLKVNELLIRQGERLKSNQVHNAAILVCSPITGEVLAYGGNIPGTGALHGEQVDLIQAERSSGSVLKPFLSMYALQDGLRTIHSLLPDIPISIDGFRPDNFSYEFEGSIPLGIALQKSQNIPFVLLLKEYNNSRFLSHLRRLGISSLRYPADHYGLSLIIGGGEVTLWNICGAYASAARILQNYNTHFSTYNNADLHGLLLTKAANIEKAKTLKNPTELDAAAVWQVFQTLSENNRPNQGDSWGQLVGGRRIAWKTGTSIGFRDAWCIGVSPDFVVGVWIGNADGEGRPGVIGLETAAPLMFEVFDRLSGSTWFSQPYDAMKETEVCANSGYAPSDACPVTKFWTPKNTRQLPVCNYDQWYHLDATGQFRVTSDCYSPSLMKQKTYFVLPPTQQYYFEQRHPAYQRLPPWKPGCSNDNNTAVISLIYPQNVSKIYLPLNQSGQINPIVLRVAHRSPDAVIYWHLDQNFIAETRKDHHLSLVIDPGVHVLTCVDNEGNLVSAKFEVVDPSKK